MKDYEIQFLNLHDSKSDLKRFIELPYSLYRSCPHWIAPLQMTLKDTLSKKNPFFEHAKIWAFVVHRNGRDLGRIAAIIDAEHNRIHNETCGFFGFFDVVDDLDCAQALLTQVFQLLKYQGMTQVRGPFNPNSNTECGVLVEGFEDPPQIMMTYHPPYVNALLQASGLVTVKELVAFRFDLTQPLEKLVSLAKRMAQRSSAILRPISKATWDRDLSGIMDIYNEAWKKNWGFVALKRAEFLYTVNDFKKIADFNFVQLAEIDGRIAAFVVALPDFNQVFQRVPNGKLFPFGWLSLLRGVSTINRFRIITLGTRESSRQRGLEVLLSYQLYLHALKKGHTEAEVSWVLEDNLSAIKVLTSLGAKPYKRYCIYQKTL